jgi:hypothetical protein
VVKATVQFKKHLELQELLVIANANTGFSKQSYTIFSHRGLKWQRENFLLE